MGIFDKLFNTVPSTPDGFNPKDEREAFIGVLYACLAADGDVSEVETDRLTQVLVFKEMFINFDIIIPYKRVAHLCQKLKIEKIIDECAPLIKEENKEMLFAVVMDLLLADGVLQNSEKEIAEYLASSLIISESRASIIIEVILIKNKGNLIVND